jgi:hypothetical protein
MNLQRVRKLVSGNLETSFVVDFANILDYEKTTSNLTG